MSNTPTRTSTILIIDAEAPVRASVSNLLEREGFDTLVAVDGNDGFDVLHANPDVDLILLDPMMPGFDGFQMLEMLQICELPPPVLVLSAKGTREDIELAITAGAHDYLIKPFDKSVLLEHVKALLDADSPARDKRQTARRRVTMRAQMGLQVTDISGSGVCIKTTFPLEEGSILFIESEEMAVKLDTARPLRLTLRVANCRGSGNRYEVGTRFVALPPEVGRKIRQANQTGSWWK